jgi:hypothetical protein
VTAYRLQHYLYYIGYVMHVNRQESGHGSAAVAAAAAAAAAGDKTTLPHLLL